MGRSGNAGDDAYVFGVSMPATPLVWDVRSSPADGVHTPPARPMLIEAAGRRTGTPALLISRDRNCATTPTQAGGRTTRRVGQILVDDEAARTQTEGNLDRSLWIN